LHSRHAIGSIVGRDRFVQTNKAAGKHYFLNVLPEYNAGSTYTALGGQQGARRLGWTELRVALADVVIE
jgi:hypothetical protein